MDWISYWNGTPSVYVSERHKVAHDRAIAEDILRQLPTPDLTMLDFGCGEARFAEDVARRCRRLYLCDAAAAIRERLVARFAHLPQVVVLAPEQVVGLAPASVDLVIVNSVVQYLSPHQLAETLGAVRGVLSSSGRLIVADVIPPDLGAVADARQLLEFAGRHGFLVDAIVGLARTLFSDYRRLRTELGLAKYREAEFIALLSSHDLTARRIHPNFGHNQQRMAFEARPLAG